MPIFFYEIAAFFFALGAIIGSFLNVVIFRLGTGRGPVGRSRCLSCGHVLGMLELVPIVSFLALRGRCLKCQSHISIQYPLIETLTGVLFLGVYLKYRIFLETLSLVGMGEMFVALVATALCVIILAYDIRHKIIPNSVVFPLIGLGLGAALTRFYIAADVFISTQVLLDLFAGPFFFLFFYSLWKISDGTWMGFGDGKLALALGFFLGFFDGLSALLFAFWIGAIVGISLMIVSKVLPAIGFHRGGIAVTMKSEIPFAPFILLGAAIVFFCDINVFSLF